jgi:DNA modification methylase
VNEVYFQSSESMAQIADGSVQAAICSPPYWNVKDYGHDAQFGYGQTYEKYLDSIDKVWKECYRVLKGNGTLWIVVDKVTRRRIMRNIPYDIALRCISMGFFLQDLIIWNKPSAIGGMNPRNFVNKYETVILLSKVPRRFKFRPQSLGGGKSPDFNSSKALTNLWRIPVRAGNLWSNSGHKAPFPDALADRLVKLSTDPGDLVLDPFLGSGTTMLAALGLNRPCIGYEINPEFKAFIEKTCELETKPGCVRFHGESLMTASSGASSSSRLPRQIIYEA